MHKNQKINEDRYLRKYPEKRLWMTAQAHARTSGREFSIGIEDIIIPEYCPYLGIKLTNITGQGRHFTNPSLDRKDNSKGYVPGNVEVISWRANRMKSNATPNELLKFADAILKRFQ